MVLVALVVASGNGALCKIQRWWGGHAGHVLAQAIQQAVFASARWANDVDQAQLDVLNSKLSTHRKSPFFWS
jgi:predicted RNA polymerase sigma factor